MNRVLESTTLGGSEALRHLLLYLADHTVLYPGQPAREKEIALGVFGRPADFDARTDSVVRVHAGRLRSKLAEYYVKEGAADRVILEVPKGAYLLVPYYREPAVREDGVAPAQVDTPPAPPGKSWVFFAKLAAGAVLLVAAAAVVY
ncbi:MAG: helix-turn-helix domain-containing protein, partial [Acidobacteriota bacterium]